MPSSNQDQLTLAFETSCDDTSVAVVKSDGFVLSCETKNQDQFHAEFGGIIPEIASRNHTLRILPQTESALAKAGVSWRDIDFLSVTNRPGLIGAVMVGLVTAKTLAWAREIPFVGVNHLEGHIWAPFLSDAQYSGGQITYPALCLAVSGGHTSLYLIEGDGHYRILGSTRDDAAGEAFDKFAKMMGLGFPGGAIVDQLASKGDASKYTFPRPMIHSDNFEMSFSGLKTSAHQYLEVAKESAQLPDLCASFQQAVVDVLVEKVKRAQQVFAVEHIILTGGVAANSALRDQLSQASSQWGCRFSVPPLRYCTDNAAMIGLAGHHVLQRQGPSDLSLPPLSQSYQGDFIESAL